MQFIANGLNGSYMSSILPTQEEEIDQVFAAIAYGSTFPNESSDLISNCLSNQWRLDIWMRYDHTVPVSISLLKRLLWHHKSNIFCNLIPDCLHAKVIWWRGYGAYIGSANHTDRAWVSNIEAGIFVPETQLQSDGMDLKLEEFFANLRATKESFPLSEEIIKELERMDKARIGIEDTGIKLRSVPVWGGPLNFDKKATHKRRVDEFRQEWQQALTTLRSIAEQLINQRPTWLRNDVPIAWQADQFLHAYYYNRVGESSGRKPYDEYYEKHRGNPNAAVKSAIAWWVSTTEAPSSEDDNLYVKAPAIRLNLSKERILTLKQEQFEKICEYTHATWDHLTKMSLTDFGIHGITSLSAPQRVPIYAEWLLKKRNRKGWSVLQLLHFVLYGGADEDSWERLYAAGKDSEYALPHYGLNSIAEVLGWARPEVSPPRNGRTSKALRALGFDVKIY